MDDEMSLLEEVMCRAYILLFFFLLLDLLHGNARREEPGLGHGAVTGSLKMNSLGGMMMSWQ
jgi:hypothetical protein